MTPNHSKTQHSIARERPTDTNGGNGTDRRIGSRKTSYSLKILLSLVFVALVLPFSVSGDPEIFGGSPEISTDGDNETTPAPLILSHIPDGILHYWTSPEHETGILFNHWIFHLFGDPGENYTIKWNGIEILSGSLPGSGISINQSYQVGGETRGSVNITIGSETWIFKNVIVTYDTRGYSIGGPGSTSPGYSLETLEQEKLTVALTVFGYSLLGLPAVGFMVFKYRSMEKRRDIK